MCGFTDCEQETRDWAVWDRTGFLYQTLNTWHYLTNPRYDLEDIKNTQSFIKIIVYTQHLQDLLILILLIFNLKRTKDFILGP